MHAWAASKVEWSKALMFGRALLFKCFGRRVWTGIDNDSFWMQRLLQLDPTNIIEPQYRIAINQCFSGRRSSEAHHYQATPHFSGPNSRAQPHPNPTELTLIFLSFSTASFSHLHANIVGPNFRVFLRPERNVITQFNTCEYVVSASAAAVVTVCCERLSKSFRKVFTRA